MTYFSWTVCNKEVNGRLLPGYPGTPGSPDCPFFPSIPSKPGVPLSPVTPLNPFRPVKEVSNISYQPRMSLPVKCGADKHQRRSNKSCMSYSLYLVLLENHALPLIR